MLYGRNQHNIVKQLSSNKKTKQYEERWVERWVLTIHSTAGPSFAWSLDYFWTFWMHEIHMHCFLDSQLKELWFCHRSNGGTWRHRMEKCFVPFWTWQPRRETERERNRCTTNAWVDLWIKPVSSTTPGEGTGKVFKKRITDLGLRNELAFTNLSCEQQNRFFHHSLQKSSPLCCGRRTLC